jgi:hypothetical protein
VRAILGFCGVALLRGLGGCAAASRTDVESLVTRFYAAYDRGDGSAACALLASETLGELEQSAGEPCASGLLEERLPAAGPVTSSDVYGDQAQVRLTGDTAFVAHFPAGWKVVAVGCTRRPERPYTCTVEPG